MAYEFDLLSLLHHCFLYVMSSAASMQGPCEKCCAVSRPNFRASVAWRMHASACILLTTVNVLPNRHRLSSVFFAAVKDLVNVVSPFTHLIEDIAAIALFDPFFSLLEILPCCNASQWFIDINGMLLSCNGGAQIHFVTPSKVVPHVFNLIFLADCISKELQRHLWAWSMKQDVVLGRYPHKAELVFKQNELTFHESMVLEPTSRYLTFARKPMEFTVALVADELNWR